MSIQSCNIPTELLDQLTQQIVDDPDLLTEARKWVAKACIDYRIDQEPDEGEDEPDIYYLLLSYWYKQFAEQIAVRL